MDYMQHELSIGYVCAKPAHLDPSIQCLGSWIVCCGGDEAGTVQESNVLVQVDLLNALGDAWRIPSVGNVGTLQGVNNG